MCTVHAHDNVHLPALFILLPVSAFYVVPCLHLFLVFYHFILVIAFRFWFFLVILYTLSTYISLSLYKLQINSVIHNQGRQFPRSFLFSHFLSFSLPFLATKHSSEDDNSEDGWLDLFLLEEEGFWLGFGGNSRFSVFNARIYGYLCSISLNLGLNLLSIPSLTCIWQASWLQWMLITRSTVIQLVVSY